MSVFYVVSVGAFGAVFSVGIALYKFIRKKRGHFGLSDLEAASGDDEPWAHYQEKDYDFSNSMLVLETEEWGEDSRKKEKFGTA